MESFLEQYSLLMYNKIYFRSLSNFTYYVRDLNALEYNSFIPLLGLILLGVVPNLIIPLLLYTLTFQVSL